MRLLHPKAPVWPSDVSEVDWVRLKLNQQRRVLLDLSIVMRKQNQAELAAATQALRLPLREPFKLWPFDFLCLAVVIQKLLNLVDLHLPIVKVSRVVSSHDQQSGELLNVERLSQLVPSPYLSERQLI